MRHVLRQFKDLFIGYILSQTLATAILIVGWALHVGRRESQRTWKSLAKEHGDPLPPSPSWILRSPGELGRRRFALLDNALLGLKGIVATWLVTWPGCALWVFAWYDGWNNSFFKGYEQSAVGPTTGAVGMVLVALTMMYHPMALARLAHTGMFRSYFDFRIIRTVVRQRAVSCLIWAASVLVLSLPLTAVKILPNVLPRFGIDTSGWSDAETLTFLDSYYAVPSLYAVVVYTFLQDRASRIYASGLFESLRNGSLTENDLRDADIKEFESLGMLPVTDPRPLPLWMKGLSWTGFQLKASLTAVGTFLIWMTFGLMVIAGEFLNHQPFRGFLNQPLIHLPSVKYVPDHLKDGH